MVTDPENWSHLEVVLGTQLLAAVCGPFDDDDDVVLRLHYLLQLVTRLRRRYDNPGVREWFTHTRVDGCMPMEVLAGDWNPQDPAVAALASAALRMV